MKDNVFESYKRVTQQIEVPVDLKEKTIQQMKTCKNKSIPWRYMSAAAAAILAVVVIGGIYFQNSQNTSPQITIAETLDINSVDEQVELSTGDLYFAQIPGEFQSPGLNLGMIEGEQISITEDEYFSYLGKNPLPTFLPEGLTKQPSGPQEITQNPDGSYSNDVFSVTYTSNTGQTLELLLSAQDIPNIKDSVELPESDVQGTKIQTAYYETSNHQTVFLAYFQNENVGYYLRSQGLSQEDFIQIILSML